MVGKDCVATVYDRAKLKAGNRIAGPAIGGLLIALSRGVLATVFMATVWSPPRTYIPSRSAVKYGAGSKATAPSAPSPARMRRATVSGLPATT